MNKNDSDHDVLVRLEANFTTFTKQYNIDIKELKEGWSQKLADHETRLRIIEKVHEEVDPVATVKEFYDIKQKVHDFSKLWKFIIAMAAIIGSIITFIFNTIAYILGWYR